MNQDIQKYVEEFEKRISIREINGSSYQVLTGKKNDHIIRHIFSYDEIEVGSKWTSNGNDVVVIINKIDEWKGIVYAWESDGTEKFHDKDCFCFQSHYCLIV